MVRTPKRLEKKMEKKNDPLGDLSTNFSKSEFRCKCKKCLHKKVLVSSLLLFKLEMMIVIIDEGLDFHKPVIVLSGNRCEEENNLLRVDSGSIWGRSLFIQQR